ncbi:DoxX family protein [Bacillus sp. FJAT-26390]|uniref:DoxX family protein n=1 Tax=Bacillus sp. FJAT-26390 TaxID=1743142 RepID=UPI000807CE31|nr:DoxX family protein [Bacillus sp. FJAT-26390]OBZ13593.1 Crp/Fnr family transcriptional regulator [Bacillus sp. FJAT-26390]
MVIRWLSENKYAAGLMLLLRVYLGWQWLSAGWHKLGGFDASGFLKGAIGNPVVDKATNELVYPTFTAFLEHVALPNAKIINVLIPLGECLVGLGLILGALTTAAAFFGLLMNFMFMFAGTVSTNPWLMLIGILVFAAGANAGKFGCDFFVLPYLRTLIQKIRNRNGTVHLSNKTFPR